jgi:excisionase family DNA binding protein
MVASPGDELLTPEQLRELLGISEATYFRWLREGKLRGQRAGRNWRFPRALVDQLLQGGASMHETRRDVMAAIQTYEALLVAQGLGKREVQAMADEGKAGKGGAALAKMMLEHAAASRAAAIHIDQGADGLRVRERIDGALAPVGTPLPKGSAREVLSAIKDLAGIAPSGEAVADGRFTTTVAGRKFYVWASTYPSAAGESMTLKLLDADHAVGGLEQFGFKDDQLALVRKLVREPSGAIIVTGPHGCGKTSTAYALLHELHGDPHIKIMTAEDPLEFQLDGVQQADVGGPNGIGHYRALQGMLEADLDVGMISEFRDAATLDLFFKAAHTGHLMLGVMHAADPVLCMKTILEVGKVPPTMLAANLLAVISQRLYRRSCPHCRETKTILAEDADALGLSGADRKIKASYNKGCAKCRQTGFRGRIMVADVFVPSERVKALIESGTYLANEAAQAGEARGQLRERLLDKVRAGEVSPREAAAYRNA